jgi:membrane protease YdiL (CAAX protease family)
MSFFWQAVWVEGGLAIIALVVGFFFGLFLWEYIWCNWETIWQITWGLAPLIVGYFVLKALPLSGVQRVGSIVQEFFRQYFATLKLWQLAVIAALAGIGEELFFRGLQLGLTEMVGMNVWLAILVTSLLFGLAHAITPTYFVLSFIVSLYFGWLFVHTGNLLVPIAIHALYDLFVLLYLRHILKKEERTATIDE